MIYLTFNDSPSGIYNSQVIDVVNYLNTLSAKKVKLVSIISIRSFWTNRSKIKKRCSNCIVLPMVPKASNWKWNIIPLTILLLFKKNQKIIARGPFATHLGLTLKKIKLCHKVIFDARGAYDAELNEYNVINNKIIKSQIKDLEKTSIEQTDYKIAVSNALIEYWKNNFGYIGNNHVVIPCTLSHDFIFEFPEKKQIEVRKKQLGYEKEDILFIYSGSSAGWQSFQLVDDLMCDILKYEPAKLIILSSQIHQSLKVVQNYPNKVNVLFVDPEKVKDYLLISDYGILYREQSITNKVASPVKFAEYLCCGLKVLISDALGDYSTFSERENLQFNTNEIIPVSYDEKIHIHRLSLEHFKKEHYKLEYLKLINC